MVLESSLESVLQLTVQFAIIFPCLLAYFESDSPDFLDSLGQLYDDHRWTLLSIVTSVFSYLKTFLLYTIAINQHSITNTGIVVIFMSMLFRGFSILILSAVLIHLVKGNLVARLFHPLVFFSFVLLLQALVFTLNKCLGKNIIWFSKNFIRPIIGFWMSIVGSKSYLACYPPIWLDKKKSIRRCFFNNSRWTLSFSFRCIVYVYNLIVLFFKIGIDPLFYCMLCGMMCDVFYFVLRLIYYNNFHVWNELLTLKTSRKRNDYFFNSELEFFSEEENEAEAETSQNESSS